MTYVAIGVQAENVATTVANIFQCFRIFFKAVEYTHFIL